jgi:hypothetical protein
VGAPYEGVWDEDLDDVYPNEIRGLIHVMGTLTLQQTARIVGTILCKARSRSTAPTPSFTIPVCTPVRLSVTRSSNGMAIYAE